MKQSKALNILKAGKNVFLTGSAGAGKTYTLNQYIKYLKERKVPVAVTASTGIAATHMNGMTIHTWAGIGIRDQMTQKNLRQMETKKYLKKHLEKVEVLIIDEISMLHKNQLDMVNMVLKHFKDPFLPFGGVQVVFSGDFFQLPPVGNRNESTRQKFAFMSKAWLEAELVICYLSEQHRQGNSRLNDILNEIRAGELSPSSINLLKLAKEQELMEHKAPPRLYTHNRDVYALNQMELGKLKTESRTFEADTKGNKKLVESLKGSVRTDADLELKIGAKVMFIKNNFEKGYINGSVGEVVGFDDIEDGYPIVQLEDGKKIIAEPEKWSIEDETGKALASMEQVPLRLAWAITIHKSQGMTLDAAEIDLGSTFERGQGYVALSRLKSLDGLRLTGFNDMALELDGLAMKADKRFKELSDEADMKYSDEALEKVHNSFVLGAGGTLDSREIRKQQRKLEQKTKKKKKSTYEQTKELVEQQMGLTEISSVRGLKESTIIAHVEKLIDQGENLDIAHLAPKEDLIKQVQDLFDEVRREKESPKLKPNGKLSMKAAYDHFMGELSYEQLRLIMLFIE